jgi:hypothetical protein
LALKEVERIERWLMMEEGKMQTIEAVVVAAGQAVRRRLAEA